MRTFSNPTLICTEIENSLGVIRISDGSSDGQDEDVTEGDEGGAVPEAEIAADHAHIFTYRLPRHFFHDLQTFQYKIDIISYKFAINTNSLGSECIELGGSTHQKSS